MKKNISTSKELTGILIIVSVGLLMAGISVKKTFACYWREFEKQLKVNDIAKATKFAQVCVNRYFVEQSFLWRN